MKVEIDMVDEVVNKPIKSGRITGLKPWEGMTVKILIMKDNGVTGKREAQDDNQ